MSRSKSDLHRPTKATRYARSLEKKKQQNKKVFPSALTEAD